MRTQSKGRRAMLASLGAVATAGALGARATALEGAPSPAPFAPLLHAEDSWMSSMPGTHRIVLDVTSPDGVPDGIRFAGNLFAGHTTGYGVKEADIAIVLCLRHGATAYGYGNAIWSKFGKTFDPKASSAPVGNPFNSGNRPPLEDLAKRGVRFIVCGTASRGLARRIAGQGGDAEAAMKEMATDLIPGARVVSAGVVGVVHAQERGFALLYVG